MLRPNPPAMGRWPVRMAAAVAVVAAALAAQAQSVVISEIHYDPPEKALREEFIELHNPGGAAVDISGWFFSSGIELRVPAGVSIPAGGFAVIAEDLAGFAARFGRPSDLGPYAGHLSGDGERIALRDAAGGLVDEVDYGVGFPWPSASAGDGSSMELIHPSMDNDLGGSWRASGYEEREPVPPLHFVPAGSTQWRYRRGDSEASSPPDAWRYLGFVEDAAWATGQTSIGYGDGDDATVLDDMLGNYTSVYLRHRFTVEERSALPASIRLRVYADDGCVVWINGAEAGRFHVPDGELAHDAVGSNHEASWEEVDVSASLLEEGENLLAVHAFNQSLTSSDVSIDVALLVPGSGDGVIFGEPTPGAPNSVYSPVAPPQIRQVAHGPRQPPSGQPFVVTAKVTDPEGVASVAIRYQVVGPGEYIPAWLPLPPSTLLADPNRPHERNPEFDDPARWTELPMVDDGTGADAYAGDSVYTVVLPAQPHRTLVRYRIQAVDGAGNGVSVPYIDDPSLNFACFVYDGVPAYTVATLTVQPSGVPHTYSREVMNSLPVYHLITRAGDLRICIAYDGAYQIPKSNEAARDRFNWEGAFVYEGFVYDHTMYRLRQANDRYGGSGKRSIRFRFPRGNYLRARDQRGELYPTRWKTLNTGKMFDNKRVGNFGLTETLNHQLWNAVGVPAPWMHTFHFRVIDAPEEAPAGSGGQYYGDFWGMALATENYDERFLEAHGLEDANLYKLKDGIYDGNRVKRNQGR
ncbi:MAG: lamin tail domain-containing protein, partial [Planctomycetes bacterium]|nr:lamin tail domain-containing protein [Planctomycetota bacterium]